MKKQICPHCWAEHWDFDDEGNKGFDCGTYITENNNVLWVGEKCYERQLAAAFEEIEKLKIVRQELNDVVNEIKTKITNFEGEVK